MERLESYLSKDYVKEKEQQKSVRELIEKVIPIYENYYENRGWGYKLGEVPNNISTSTTAMIIFSMSVLMSGKLDLITDDTGENFLKEYDNNKLQENFHKIFEESLALLLNNFKNGIDKFTFYSNTYGENDPFTLMWTRHLIDNYKCNYLNCTDHEWERLKCNVDNIQDIIEVFDNKCKNKVVYEIFKILYENNSIVKYSSKIDNAHIFPLLKIVQLYYAMTPQGNGAKKDKIYENISEIEKKDVDKYVDGVRNTLKNNLHHHLSLSSIENSNFDAAELVFSLEGLLLLDFNKNNFDQNLLNRVFQVIKERQEISIYWRPLKPFISQENGFALLPLSAEIAMSLIRICRLLGKRGKDLFAKNYEMFAKYTEWLKTRLTVIPCDKGVCDGCEINKWCSKKNPSEKKFYGWCSEHIYKPNVIHLWETSQVLVYLVNFHHMLQEHIAYQSFEFANLSNKYFVRDEKAWEEWQKKEPINIEDFDVYKNIGNNYLSNSNYYSMLLFGPPGTGKSTVAEKIAETKGWHLVTITPSNFITSGADQVETKVKNIFNVLEEQKNIVVLFDEIDRLILDRDSKYYSSQSDLFQFMTPSMLVKLKELRRKEKIIFIIATNYEERIDKAIKRKGRIDKSYLLLPPNMAGREKLFKDLMVKKLKKSEFEFEELFEKCKEFIIRNTVFFTYNEFDQLTDEIKNKYTNLVVNNKVDENKLKNLKIIEKPAITLMSYHGKLGTTNEEKNVQRPIKEYLSLVFLKAESNYEFDKNELDLLIDFLESDEMLSHVSGERCILTKIQEMLGMSSERNTKNRLTKILEDTKLTEKLNYHIDKGMTKIILNNLNQIKNKAKVGIKEAVED